ncbi:hypothetical protein [Tropicimonas sediminicola]|uniref:Predicted secreted Zn-dependent protease n=1 Tax=Tropicimonas sediminicola TaxID=1031541 RepID=A0A239FR38_9RHOB|nr:hypothetical protein [Tropicimonas sediminicola]SNS58354.1 Predicted secreted Zn-dependent protease [Tropicimonas sediminicola]
MPLRPLLTCLLLLLPALAAAETPLTAEEFDARTQGRTLFFYSEGRAYGAERYRENGRVTWTFLDGQCKEGRWYPEGRFICFVYDDTPDPQCWTFFDSGNGLRALFEDREGATELYEAGEAEEPLFCLGPEVGA